MASIIPPSNTLRQQCRWHTFATATSLEHAAALAIFNASKHAIRQHHAFHIVLAGGTTPRRVYELLGTMEANWQAWHIYFGDERCLPEDHAERNSHMAGQVWLEHVSIPASQIHVIPAEQGAETAASVYARELGKVDMFDMVILGLGEDGHTASLFPEKEWGVSVDSPATIAVYNAPKPPSERVSLTAHRLSKTHQLFFLVSGAAKRQALREWRDGKDIPAAAIAPACGVDVFVEEVTLS